MGKREYLITLHTPLGDRYGSMSVAFMDRVVNGVMEILDHMEPFHGTIDENGNCRISGRLMTLVRMIEYTAVGTISPESVQLTVQGERNVFKLYGKVFQSGN